MQVNTALPWWAVCGYASCLACGLPKTNMGASWLACVLCNTNIGGDYLKDTHTLDEFKKATDKWRTR